MGYSVVNVDELEGGGTFRFVRRELGVEAFGINWIELPPRAEGLEHDEADSGQEEVNVCVRGSGTAGTSLMWKQASRLPGRVSRSSTDPPPRIM